MVNIETHITGLKKSFQKMYNNKFERVIINKDTVVRFIPTSNENIFSVQLHFYVSTKENYDNEHR